MSLPVFFALAGSSKQTLLPTSVQTSIGVDWDPAKCATLPSPESRVCEFGPLFNEAGKAHGVDPRYLAAVAYVESHYRADIIDCETLSADDAAGIMQFIPGTANERGVDPCNTSSAITGAAEYLKEMYDQFASWDLAAAGYHDGPGAVSRAGNAVPGNEVVQNYVRDVKAKWEQYQALFPSGPAECGASPRGSTEPDPADYNRLTPATRKMYDAVVSCFGRPFEVYCYDPRDGTGEHPKGRACDFMISSGGHGTADEKAHGKAIAEWVMMNATELDVKYIIWDRRNWSPANDNGQTKPVDNWRTYPQGATTSDANVAHTNHVHVSINN
jgi:hypothetical protein